jgi:hypothetical protein
MFRLGRRRHGFDSRPRHVCLGSGCSIVSLYCQLFLRTHLATDCYHICTSGIGRFTPFVAVVLCGSAHSSLLSWYSYNSSTPCSLLLFIFYRAGKCLPILASRSGIEVDPKYDSKKDWATSLLLCYVLVLHILCCIYHVHLEKNWRSVLVLLSTSFLM